MNRLSTDYAQLHKIYGAPTPDESRYSPAYPEQLKIKTLSRFPIVKFPTTTA